MDTKKKKNLHEKIDIYYDDFWEEQERLKLYIQQRTIPRPKTTIISILVWVFIYILVSFFATVAITYTFHIENYKWLVYLVSCIVFAFLFLKRICIKSIECYQHYAKEEIRRK